MKNKKLMLHTTIALCAIALVFVLPIATQPQLTQLPDRQTGGGISLQPPAFFQAAYAQDAESSVCTSDLLSDAGVMAYVDLETELDVSSLSSFDSVEEQTEQYIKGSFLPPGFDTMPEYDEAANVQMVVCSDGWLIAYLPKDQLSAALIVWPNYNKHKIRKTPLEEAIEKIVEELELKILPSPNAISYYDARYPDATAIKLVADSIQRTDENQYFYEDFQIVIPKKLTIYEFAWTHANSDIDTGASYLAQSECKLNETPISNLRSQTQNSWLYSIKALDNAELLAGKTYNFVLTHLSAGSTLCGVAIVYGEAAQ